MALEIMMVNKTEKGPGEKSSDAGIHKGQAKQDVFIKEAKIKLPERWEKN